MLNNNEFHSWTINGFEIKANEKACTSSKQLTFKYVGWCSTLTFVEYNNNDKHNTNAFRTPFLCSLLQ